MTPGNKELRKKLKLQDWVDFETTKLITGKCLFCGAEFKEIYDLDIIEKIRAFRGAHGVNCPKFKYKKNIKGG